MRTVILTLCLVILGATAAAQEPEIPAADRAFVEIETARDSYYVEEPIHLTVRFGLDRRFFRTKAVSLFVRQVDLPVQILAPWIDAVPGTVRQAPGGPPLAGTPVSFVLNSKLSVAMEGEDRKIAGRTFRVLSLTRFFLPVEPGELIVPSPELRFAFGTEFDEDFVNGRRARDRKEVVVTGAPLRLDITGLPENRPTGFTGAVGRFAVRADAAPREISAGGRLRVTLEIEGEGNLDRFSAPTLDLPGFHVLGHLDDMETWARRVLQYELLTPYGGISEVPPIPFVFFDPAEARYRVVRTAPIPITVHGKPPPKSEPDEEGKGTLLIVLVTGAVFAVIVAVLLIARIRGARNAVDPDEERARAAAAVFGERIAEAHADLADAFGEYLSARLRAPTASLIGPGLTERLVEAGVPRDLAARAAARMEELVGVRYGGDTSEDAAAACRALVGELEAVFDGEE